MNRGGASGMAADGVAARAAAAELLGSVLGQGMMLSDALAEASGPMTALGPGDRARAQRLAATTLRHLERADRVLSPHLRKAPPRLVQNVLRLAVTEVAVMGAPLHSVVNAAVDIVRRGRRTGHMTGFVNAVLRGLPEGGLFAGLPPQRLPQWLRQPMVRTWGREAVTAIEAVQAWTPPLDLTLRPGARPPAGAERLPTGSWRLAAGAQVTALPGFAEGAWWVQDAAAAIPARLLPAAPGVRLLDLCAAPGGKTLQLAAAGAAVTALDISRPRLGRLAENLGRCGLAAELVAADALHWQPAGRFDAVLVDAPCSASGTIRRHPDLPFVKDGSDLAALLSLQAQLIDRALLLVRPGGTVVFCTCSLLPDEGEGQVLAALARHPGLSADTPLPEGLPETCRTAEGGLRLRPDLWADRGGVDGFYIARLQRPATP
jgi:16S rRNA (cytosine967-C5)-methyltransferase